MADRAAGPLLEVDGVSLAIHGHVILREVGLAVRPREIVTLIGPNGAGKTMLVRVVLGLIRADEGRIRLRPGIRIGYMPQRLAMEETLPLTVRRFITLGTPAPPDRVQRLLAETGTEHLLNSPVQSVSGGEMQRVLLARALLREPQLLVLDEPVQAMDVSGQYELYDLIMRIRDRHGCGILMVSHDLHLVMSSTDQVVCLNRHVCCSGHPDSVARHPSYLELFGREALRHVAVYHHQHDHRHDLHGEVVFSNTDQNRG